MADPKTRREVLVGGAAMVAAVTLPSLSSAQEALKTDVPFVEKQLAKPLSPEAREILRKNLDASRDTSQERLKTTLPENSEPCFNFVPRPKEKRRW